MALLMALFNTSFLYAGSLVGWWVFDMLAFSPEPLAYSLFIVVGIKRMYNALVNRKKQSALRFEKEGALLLISFAVALDVFLVSLGIAYMSVDLYSLLIFVYVSSFFLSIAGSYSGKKIVCPKCPLIFNAKSGLLLLLLGVILMIRFQTLI